MSNNQAVTIHRDLHQEDLILITGAGGFIGDVESDADFEKRTTARDVVLGGEQFDAADLPPSSAPTDLSGPTQAIETYKRILSEFPWYERNDQVLYQMARAYDELSDPDEAMRVVERLIAQFPGSKYVDEVYFRRGEYHFVRRKFRAAQDAYQAVVSMGEASPFYELALYKLGWSFYKQDLYDEALHQFVALLDYRLSQGYDFDASVIGSDDEGDERRVADTFRVVSLSFTNLGGPEVLNEYFATFGNRAWISIIKQLFSHTVLVILIIIFLVLLIVGIVVWLFERKINHEHFGGNAIQGIGSGVWFAAVTMTAVGYGDKHPNTLGGRITALILMFTGVILVSIFTATITSILTVKQLETSVHGIEDLKKALLGTMPYTTSESFLKNSLISFKTYTSVEEGLESLLNGEIEAFVYDAPELRYEIKQRFQGKLELLPQTYYYLQRISLCRSDD